MPSCISDDGKSSSDFLGSNTVNSLSRKLVMLTSPKASTDDKLALISVTIAGIESLPKSLLFSGVFLSLLKNTNG